MGYLLLRKRQIISEETGDGLHCSLPAEVFKFMEPGAKAASSMIICGSI